MLYMGGKSRIAKELAATILSVTPRRDIYIEPFLGGGNSFLQLAPHFKIRFAGDVHEDLMLLWKAVQDGWQPPNTLSETDYKALQYAKPSALRGFAGFGCSFGGKWFGGYARSKKVKDNYYADHTARSLNEIAKVIRNDTSKDVNNTHTHTQFYNGHRSTAGNRMISVLFIAIHHTEIQLNTKMHSTPSIFGVLWTSGRRREHMCSCPSTKRRHIGES